MATGQSIINRSLRLLGQVAAGEDPTTDESADALVAVNALLSSWNNEGLMGYATEEETLTLATSDASYTIGPSGDVNTTRPVEIIAAWVVESNVSYPVRIISDEEYAAIPDKTTTSDWPDRLNYKPTMATGTITVYPVPNGSGTLKLLVRVPLEALALADTVSLPPGWERALAYNLAVELAPEYETQPSEAVIRAARESKGAIKSVNSRPIKGYTDLAHMFPGGRSNILSDQ